MSILFSPLKIGPMTIKNRFMHYTMESGKGGKRTCALYNEKHANAWKSTINKVHNHGAKLVFQINHGGIGVLLELEKRSP